ncbi:winged helix DNA-binding domain-containing protein [Paramicrobacterium fandaimingii]|uniref:winged helix DNA-binding domain-containing protein n=1 Tax=Paramicrobacterium fandaimingii TaxID=2708079 RepID=UPI00141E088F|nr:winged helix DNA-binding domain-containing protein [Microbacterium fandaimingii]
MTAELTAAQLRRARWHSLALSGESIATAPAVVDRLGALQGQDLPGVLISLAIRAKGTTVHDARRHFDDGTLVRGWPMRGTLHVLRAEDLLPMAAVTRKRVLGGMAGQARRLDISQSTISRVIDAVTDVLSVSEPVGRAELREIVVRAHGGEPAREVVSHLIYQLCTRGLICHGPFRGEQHLIVHTESWLGAHPASARVSNPDLDDFLAQMLKHYVTGHGPVSEADAARWFGLPLTTIREARLSLGEQLVTVLTPSGAQWMSTTAETERILSSLSCRPRVRLLPGFDEFMLGYADRSFAVPAHARDEIVPAKNGMFRSTVCAGASVVGTWSKGKLGEQLHVQPFAELSAHTKQGIHTAAQEIGRVTGKQVSVRLPH